MRISDWSSDVCSSDLSARFGAAGAAALIGPKRSPLGLAADPGGLPLYKKGVLVGGIGVMGDGDYGSDPNILDTDSDAERSEERRVGKEGVSTGRCRGAPCH